MRLGWFNSLSSLPACLLLYFFAEMRVESYQPSHPLPPTALKTPHHAGYNLLSAILYKWSFGVWTEPLYISWLIIAASQAHWLLSPILRTQKNIAIGHQRIGLKWLFPLSQRFWDQLEQSYKNSDVIHWNQPKIKLHVESWIQLMTPAHSLSFNT